MKKPTKTNNVKFSGSTNLTLIIEELKNEVKKFLNTENEINDLSAKLLESQKDILARDKQAKQIKDTDIEQYNKMVKENQEKLNEYTVMYYAWQEKKEQNQKNMDSYKKDTLKKLSGMKKLLTDNMDLDVNTLNLSELKEKRKMLQQQIGLAKTTDKEFDAMTDDQKKEVKEARKNLNENKKQLRDVRDKISLIHLIGKKSDKESKLQKAAKIDDIMKLVDENVNREDIQNLDKKLNGKIDDKDKGKDKDENEQNEIVNSVDDLGKDDKDENVGNNNESNKDNQDDINHNENDKYVQDIIEDVKSNDEFILTLNKMSAVFANETDTLKILDELKDMCRRDTAGLNLKLRIHENKQKIDELQRNMKDNPDMAKDYQAELDGIMEKTKKLQEKYDRYQEQWKKDEERANIIMPYFKDKLKEYANNQQTQKQGQTGGKKDTPQIAEIIFDAKNGVYRIIDENNNQNYHYPFLVRDEKYVNSYTKEDIKAYRSWAIKEFGLTKKQAKNIDISLFELLEQYDKNLLDNYINSIKTNGRFDKGFNLIYDFREKNKNIKRMDMKSIIKVADKQSKYAIAKVQKDKLPLKTKIIVGLAGVLGALGLSGAVQSNLLNDAKQPKMPGMSKELDNDSLNLDMSGIKKDAQDIIEKNKNKNKDNDNIQNEKTDSSINEKDYEKTEEKTGEKNGQKVEEKNEGIHSGDYVKVKSGALLYRDPTDSLRIKNGQNAGQKIQIKPETSKDRVYRVTMEGYYSLDGNYISVKEGEDIKEVLKSKGLDEKFLSDAGTIKMYHTVSDGIAQWVEAEDVEKNDIKLDKFGNPIEKSEAEKVADEAYKAYQSQQKQENQIQR